jgi:hypothetical protein
LAVHQISIIVLACPLPLKDKLSKIIEFELLVSNTISYPGVIPPLPQSSAVIKTSPLHTKALHVPISI